NSFDITRNSVADSGAMLLRVGYNDAVSHLYTSGLFRGFARGISEPVINNRSAGIANGDVPGYFDTWGIANDGTAWFIGVGSLWRSRPAQAPVKIFVSGDKIVDGANGGILLNYSQTEEL